LTEYLAQWATGLSSRHFQVVLALGAVLAVACLVGMVSRLRRLGVVENTATSRLRSAAQGYVELEGRACLLPGEPIRAPLSGRRCAWWAFRVDARGEIGADSRSSAWEVMDRERSEAIFCLDDDTGRCIVDPDGAEVLGASARTWYGNSRRPAPHEVPERWGLNKRYRYTEWRIDEDAPLYAAGYLLSPPQAESLGMQEEVAELLRAWKRHRESLVQRFDRDGNGEIDLAEWELARRQAWREVEAGRRDAVMPPGISVLARPADGRPFVLAAGGQQDLRRRWRGQLAACALGFVALAAAVAWLAAARGGGWQ